LHALTGQRTTTGVPTRSGWQQRVADYYARTTKEQEDRENAEVRERFAASQRKNST
jgi:hypothetical protein